MTTATPAIYGQFGQALGLAERTLTANLRAHLAERGTDPETWYVLQLIAMRGPGLSRRLLSRELERPPSFDAEAVRALLARLDADGLIRGEAEVDLTAAGAGLHRSLREFIIGPTIELLSQFERDDIETTVRTLEAITERAARH
jgi:hypothetical protein